jgi:microcystin degradation protein MlrC
MRGGGDSASGFVDYAQSHADTFQLCPSVLAIANPSGTIAAETWRELKTMLLKGLEDEIRKNGGIDCVALHLHGAGVSEDSTDLEGILLEEIRALVGPRVVIVANLDLHAKFTPKMHANVDVINAVLTYPHIDHNPRSQQLLALVPGILEGKLKPTRYVERLPFLLVSAPTVPNQGFLMSEVREMCEAAMKKEGVLDCSVLHGFPFSDVAYPGIHVLVTTNGNPGLAKEIALEIARFIWENKERAVPKTISPEQAVEKAKSILSSQGRLDVTPKPPTSTRPDVGTYSFLPDSDGSKPVIIADAADNPGGGSTGDGTYLLKAVWESRVERAAFIGLYDPENVEKVGLFLRRRVGTC